jgi:4-hydroxybenzoate polyprenyltransferase
MLFLKRLRPLNLILIALSQYLVYKVFAPYENNTIIPLLFSTFWIGAAGNIHNDYCDILSDQINKKENFFSGFNNRKIFWPFYILSNLSALYIGYVYTEVFYVLFFCSAFLYLYNWKIQKTAIFGNLVIALLSSISLYLPLIPVDNSISELPSNLFILLCFLLASCFYLQFFREVVKDLIDYKGDYNAGFQTLPILIGKERTYKIMIVLSSVCVIALIYFLVWFVPKESFSYLYFVLGLLLPACYLMALTLKKKDALLLRISQIIKILIGFGILYMTLYL